MCDIHLAPIFLSEKEWKIHYQFPSCYTHKTRKTITIRPHDCVRLHGCHLSAHRYWGSSGEPSRDKEKAFPREVYRNRSNVKGFKLLQHIWEVMRRLQDSFIYTEYRSTMEVGLMESLALPGLRQDVQGGGAQRRWGTGGHFRMSHLLPFWKNSSRLSLNGCRYSFGDSLHTTAICFSLAVKRRWQSDFLKNTDLLNSCSVLSIKWEILTHHYLSKWQGRKQNQKTTIITHSITFFRNREMHHLQPLLIFLKKRSKTSDLAQVKNSAFWSLEKRGKSNVRTSPSKLRAQILFRFIVQKLKIDVAKIPRSWTTAQHEKPGWGGSNLSSLLFTYPSHWYFTKTCEIILNIIYYRKDIQNLPHIVFW